MCDGEPEPTARPNDCARNVTRQLGQAGIALFYKQAAATPRPPDDVGRGAPQDLSRAPNSVSLSDLPSDDTVVDTQSSPKPGAAPLGVGGLGTPGHELIARVQRLSSRDPY